MVKVSCSSTMVGIMLGNGETIKCMGTGNFTIKMAKWPMREIGRMTNSVVLAECLMIGPRKCPSPSTTMISHRSTKNGYTMKDNLETIPSMAREN